MLNGAGIPIAAADADAALVLPWPGGAGHNAPGSGSYLTIDFTTRASDYAFARLSSGLCIACVARVL